MRYEVRPQPAWREDTSHKFVKTVPCGGCHEHAKQTQWWAADMHSGTIEPFTAISEESQGIARAYGIAVGDMRKGAQTCMWCHGTITSSPRLDVRNSVGCQMCHGAGKAYEKPHEDGIYAESLLLGLTDLKDADVRARTCAGCHYITDPGLIAAGHESGDSVDFAEQVSQIKHWGPEFGGDASEIGASTLASAYASVLAARGPVPQVTPVATPPQATSDGTGGAPTVGGGDAAPDAGPPEAPAAGAPSGSAVASPPPLEAGAAPAQALPEGLSVTFQPSGTSCVFQVGDRICDIAKKAGVPLSTDCETGSCGEDPVRVLAGLENLSPKSEEEQVSLSAINGLEGPHYRLACVTFPNGPVVVELVE